MTPFKQNNIHNVAEGVIGDCYRTCLACLLDLRPGSVPHFVEIDGWDKPPAESRVNELTRQWLNGWGYDFIEIAWSGLSDPQQALDILGGCAPDIYYIFSGLSRNGTNHSVIGLNNNIVHDPAIDNSGIVGPMTSGQYTAMFLVPLIIKNRQ